MPDRKSTLFVDEFYRPPCPPRPAGGNGSHFYPVLVTALTTAVLMGAGFFLMLPRNIVTREDVSKMMQTEGPYIEDREAIKQTLHDHGEKLGRLDENLELLMRSQGVQPVPQKHTAN